MVVSLYVCEIPRSVTKKDIENLFGDYEGYIETRLKSTQDSRKIAFIDYESEPDAKFVLDTLQGFRFSPEDKGMIMKISDNTKGGNTQKSKPPEDRMLNRKRRSESESERSDKGRMNKPYNDRKREDEKQIPSNNSNQQTDPNILNSFLKIIEMSNQNNPPNKNINNPISNNPYTMNENNQTPNNINPNPNITDQNTNPVNLFEVMSTLQLLQSLSNPSNNSMAPQENLITPTPQVQKTQPISNIPQSSNKYNSFSSSFFKYDDQFKNHIDFKRNATNIVYVEGLPNDTNEREVAHVFRPFPGFKSVRLITREKNGEKTLLCFADFEDVLQSTICINTLQGYRFDKNDLLGLHFSYGVTKNKK